MRKQSRPRFILIGIGILALILCLWVIWDGPRDGPLNPTNLTPQTISNDEAPQSGSVRNRGAEREQVRLEASRSKYPEEPPPTQRSLPQLGSSEKRRPVQSIITGIVANSQDGVPIQDARVTLSTAGSEEVPLEAVSGHDGRFRMTIQSAGRYMLMAEADGFRPYFIDRLFIAPMQGSLQQNILMTPRVQLRGRVVDHHSRGIAKASVWLRKETARGFRQSSLARTDESGIFLTDTAPPSGNYFLEAGHPEYELDARVPVTMPRDEEVVITMRRVPETLLASLSVHVRDTDGHPIPGAWVRLEGIDSSSRTFDGMGHSLADSAGHFLFPRVRLGKYNISANAQGYARAMFGQGNKDLIIESNREYEINLVLQNETRVYGVVLDPEGLPLAEADVSVSFDSGTARKGTGSPTYPDGTFDIPGVPPGRHQLQVAHSDYANYESSIVTPTDDFLTITLHPGLSLTGYVVDQNNEPIREFSLRLSPTSSQHDPKFADVSPADGYFTVNGLTPQTYYLSVNPPNADGWFTRFEFLESTSVTIVLERSGSGSRIRIRNY